ncbi:MAG TPA: phosphoglucomutase (alpha-D-glucose-1,6-bisphosphate-dependent) [Longimicrobiales bacterium]|nr:phosphoglucomutase (alpha-D-glucose-1,6-bisphosphate-dependent) [Longimicrobiales bacterium]
MNTSDDTTARAGADSPGAASELTAAYHDVPGHPRPAAQRVAFGTSGHRGSSLQGTFNEDHIVAISQAVAEHRRTLGIGGPLFLGMDTHALSAPALATAVEVLAANGVRLIRDAASPYTPTPVISHAIINWNRAERGARADGLILTPSHNPPEDGGIKYNPPHGGAADTDVTSVVEARANEILSRGVSDVRRTRGAEPGRADLARSYIDELGSVIDMPAIAASGIRIGVDPLGGSSIDYWERIAAQYGLAIEVVNPVVDASFAFMPPDRDGRIRMDCSSPWAMAGLVALRDRFDIAVGLDPDADRHGIVTPTAGLLNPNHYLSVAVWYLFRTRTGWPTAAGVGKTLVSSAMIDRVAQELGRDLIEVPVGFKWFVAGLESGAIAFAGEESAGATFLRHDGRVWTTDKDGMLLALLAAEITARTGRDPGELYRDLEQRFGAPAYERIDAPANAAQKRVLAQLAPTSIRAEQLAGERIVARLTRAPGNDAPIGGLKVVTENGWFAARPSGTEDVYKIYAESFLGAAHLERLQQEAQALVDEAFRDAGV